MHMHLHVKCLSEFFEVIVINQDCDYQQICDIYQPDLTLFESGFRTLVSQKIKIKNTSAYPEIPKLGLHNGDSWCDCRAGFLSDMEHWGIETFFSICTTTAEHTPEIANNLFVWANFIDTDIYRDYSQPKIVPVLFTGRTDALYPWRQKIQKIISENYPSLICPHLGYEERVASRMFSGEKYARLINASWFVPTCGSVAKEVVRKHFEIPASKSCLITEKSPALEAAGFIDMENCVFADEDNVLNKLDYLFQNQDELERITNLGYQLVHSRHTLKQRDQIFQWFNLYKNLKPNQKIVQKSPFEPLTIVEKSSDIQNSHIICNGLNIVLIRQGDEKLWSGKYAEAEALYLCCLSYIFWMPEPKLRLALCNLYKGNAGEALSWIIQPIKDTLETYKALDPEPVEWAYFIITLLCQGKLDEAIKRANQFPSLLHPELERTRWAVNLLNNNTIPYSEPSKYRYSIHQLPKHSFTDWVNNLCIMLQACQQFSFVETLSKSVSSEYQSLFQGGNSSVSDTEKLIKYPVNIHSNWLQKLLNKFETKPTVEPYYVFFKRRFILNLLKPLIGEALRRLETQFGYFLPYNVSAMRNDEFFYAIQKLVEKEDINRVLIIGANAGNGSTEAVLTGIQKNSNKPTVFCLNVATPRFAKIQNFYAKNSSVNCIDISSFLKENFSKKINTCIEKIQQEHKINQFDVILIDSSELTVTAELNDLYGANFVLLDDISTNNYKNYHKILTDQNYTLVAQNPSLRNGYAIFRKVDNNSKLQILSTESIN